MNRVTQRERDALRLAAARVVRIDADGEIVGGLYEVAARLAQQEHVSVSRAQGAVSRVARKLRYDQRKAQRGD